MATKHRLNRDIYHILSQPELESFSIAEVRVSLQKHSNLYNNKNSDYLFVARQLQSLFDKGLLNCEIRGRNKRYTKTAAFYQTEFKLREKRVSRARLCEPVQEESQGLIYHTLEIEKVDIETELTLALAEIEEYKKLMQRSNELHELLTPSYARATRKSGALMAKLNVLVEAIGLARQSCVSEC
ncbi:hypothetical protein AB6E21_18550 [Photobacterium swingsii]|uniref:hypothetical protein n=1 Tax=Photobacterium swingsii TaxID=680026 RepID=UPI003551B7A9